MIKTVPMRQKVVIRQWGC